MRALKFRAWEKQEGKMYEVSVIRFGVQHGMARGDLADYVELDSKSRSYIAGDHIDLMQFTGLTDYHNKEIYEGDVVQITGLYGDQQQAKVFWGPVAASYEWMNGETWLLHFTSGAEGPLYPYCKPRNYYRLEIIGNLYEHPELLEGGKS